TGASAVNFIPLHRALPMYWQKAHGYVPTGYVTGEQNQALLSAATVAVASFDQELQRQQQQAAETTENALQLSTLDRQHVQVALTSQEHKTDRRDLTINPRT